MKIISIDVGIKNMAFCLFDISGSKTDIIDWKVISMLEEDAPVIYCNAPAVKTVLKKQKKLENFFEFIKKGIHLIKSVINTQRYS